MRNKHSLHYWYTDGVAMVGRVDTWMQKWSVHIHHIRNQCKKVISPHVRAVSTLTMNLHCVVTTSPTNAYLRLLPTYDNYL